VHVTPSKLTSIIGPEATIVLTTFGVALGVGVSVGIADGSATVGVTAVALATGARVSVAGNGERGRSGDARSEHETSNTHRQAKKMFFIFSPYPSALAG
jgi:hypothetical protein